MEIKKEGNITWLVRTCEWPHVLVEFYLMLVSTENKEGIEEFYEAMGKQSEFKRICFKSDLKKRIIDKVRISNSVAREA